MPDTLYGARATSLTTSDLYTIDPATAVCTSVGPIGFAVTGLAFDPMTGTLYGATSPNSAAHPKSLITIDPLTGAGTFVGAFGGASARGFSDLACDSAGNLYGWYTTGTGPAGLYTIDKATGTATAVGGDTSGHVGGGISFDSTDVLYLCGGTGDLWTVDPGTGAGTLVNVFTGDSVGSIDAVTFGPSDVLYVGQNLFDGPPPNVDLATVTVPGAVATLVAALSVTGVDALAWILAAPPATVGRVLIALDDTALAENPTWTRIDDTANLVSGIDIRRGRQSEFDETETSTATVFLNDKNGDFDPNNTGSPYFGRLDGKQILLQVRNPVSGVWEPQTRMTIDEVTHDFNPALNANGEPLLATVALECVDLFDYLAGVEMIPGLFGDAPPTGSERTVFYEDTTGGTGMQTRLVQLAADAGVPAGRTRFFTGNVDLQETKYDPGESLLVPMRDAVDAEFPDLANLATNRRGTLFAHGRLARFTPEAVASGTDWDFRRWKAGDGTAILADSDRAQIRPPLQWTRPRSRVVNAAMCTPKGIANADVPGQIVVDTTSRDALGYHSWSALDLIVKAGATTGFTANGECKSFARFKVENYKDEHTRVEAITFQSLRPDDPRAASTWDLLCAVDISDVIELTHGYPGGVGLTDEAFYVEGMETQIRPLNQDFDWIEKTVNVSPASSYPPDYVFSDA